MKKQLSFNLIKLQLIFLILQGCVPSDIASSRRSPPIAPESCPQGVSCSTRGSTLDEGSILPPKVEIRHLIEPNLETDSSYFTGTGQPGGGSYVRKLTLPKNFAGKLYVAGVNVDSLKSQIVKVRFKFGQNHAPVTLPAFVTKAPGITPDTNISVLVLNLRSAPFQQIRLPYDLFDYNEYETDETGEMTEEPTQDNRDPGLYCRGLNLEDDPTFNGSGNCDHPSEECHYAYAKIMDQGLVQKTGNTYVPLTPSYPQINSEEGLGYLEDFMAKKLLKPLPDSMFNYSSPYVHFSQLSIVSGSQSLTFNTQNLWDPVTILGNQYYYRGPYRIMNRSQWEFAHSFENLHGKNRLFKENAFISYDLSTHGALVDDSLQEQNRIYFEPYLFPLKTKLSLGGNVSYLSSELAGGQVETLLAAGKTQWMSGSNSRAQSRNFDFEHVGSCNVTSLIEILGKDAVGEEYVLASTREIKLQLVRPTEYRTDPGLEVLYSNYKTCQSSLDCSSSECCFNNRCWSDSLVSTCPDSSILSFFKKNGESCQSDLECSSLCCNTYTQECSVHNNLDENSLLCGKPLGESCIAQEWCDKVSVVKCYVVKTGVDAQGNTTCTQHCENIELFADCKNGVCVPPPEDDPSDFDPTASNACDNAINVSGF